MVLCSALAVKKKGLSFFPLTILTVVRKVSLGTEEVVFIKDFFEKVFLLVIEFFVITVIAQEVITGIARTRKKKKMPNKLDRLLPQAHKFRGWLSQEEAVLYNDYLRDYRNEILDKLTKEGDSIQFYRLQGSLSVINNLLELRGEVDLYIKGCSNGTMRPITKEKANV
jgi:hypothetical protein